MATSSREENRWFEDLERYVACALLTAGLAGLLVITSPPFRDRLDAARWLTGWVVVTYLGISLAAFGLAVGLALLLRRPGARAVVLRGAAALALVLIFFSNLDVAGGLVSGEGGLLVLVLGVAGLLASVLGLVWASVGPGPGLGWLRAAVVVVAVACALLLWPGFLSARSPLAQPPQITLTGERLLVIGLDGADWRYIDQLTARGELPNLSRLRDQGAWGRLATIRPTASPLIWTTMATGRRPDDHGVLGHVLEQPVGSDVRLPGEEWGIRNAGLHQIMNLLLDLDLVVRSPSTSTERRVPAFWNVASHFGSPISVVSWWATWPAEPVLGRIVSDRTYFWRWTTKSVSPTRDRLTFPESLYDELAGEIMEPADLTLDDALTYMDVGLGEFERMQSRKYSHHMLESEFKYFFSMFETNRRIGRRIIDLDLESGQEPCDLFVLFRLIDLASHSALSYSELVSDHLGASEDQLERYGRVVSEAYRQADAAVGELVGAFGPANVVILSDHGFQLEEKQDKSGKSKARGRWKGKKSGEKTGKGDRKAGEKKGGTKAGGGGKGDREGGDRKGRPRLYHHALAPDGIFVAAGPAFRQGEVEGLSVYDVMTILLYLKGLPISRDLERVDPPPIFVDDFVAVHPPQYADDYSFVALADRSHGSSGTDEEMVDRLRALGYMD